MAQEIGSKGRPFDDEVLAIRRHVYEMGRWAINMVHDGLLAMDRGDPGLAREVFEHDDRLDRFDVEIEADTIRALVTQQPAARDLRFLGSCLKIISYLDRTGRLGRDIASYAVDAPHRDHFPPWPTIRTMGERAEAMMQLALEAFRTGDVHQAAAVYDADDAVDDMNRKVLEECARHLDVEHMSRPQLLQYVLVARHLERVADNSCKVAEKVIYIGTGHRRREFLSREKRVFPKMLEPEAAPPAAPAPAKPPESTHDPALP